MRTVVVGASSGLGRCIGIGLTQRGSQTALLARRHQKLVEAAKEAGPGTLAIACDVTDADSVKAAVAEAAAGLGGIDALVYATGIGPLGRLTDIGPDVWAKAFATNATGAALVTAAAIGHLEASNGSAVYLSSISASQTPPWPGLGAYAVSKAALDKLVEAWRAEHPCVGFTRMAVGDCAGGQGDATTQFVNEWDWDVAARFHPTWVARNYITGTLLDVELLINAVHHVLESGGGGASIPSMVVAPRPAPEQPSEAELPEQKPVA